MDLHTDKSPTKVPCIVTTTSLAHLGFAVLGYLGYRSSQRGRREIILTLSDDAKMIHRINALQQQAQEMERLAINKAARDRRRELRRLAREEESIRPEPTRCSSRPEPSRRSALIASEMDLIDRLRNQQSPSETVYLHPRAVASSSKLQIETGAVRPTFAKNDFISPMYARDHDKIDAYLAKFPMLLKRNHYVLQYHYATAKHFDLRIQMWGFMVSFAIPKGLSHWDDGRPRIAIMTTLHPLAYSLFEGGVDGTTCGWDIGTYRWIPSKASRDPNTPTDTNPDSDDESQSEDANQEDKFAHSLYRTLFGVLPPYYNTPGRTFPVVPKANGTTRARAFCIELTGKRYQGLCLTFLRKEDDWKFGIPKGGIDATVRTQFMVLKTAIKSEAAGDTSVLSGRTMDEVSTDSNCYAQEGRGGIGWLEKQKLGCSGPEITTIMLSGELE